MSYRSFSIPLLGDHLFSERFMQMDNMLSRLSGEKHQTDIPAYNLLQKDKDCYEITVSVPGYTQDELDISVLNNQLTISGKPDMKDKPVIKDKDGMKWLHQGIRKCEFCLTFCLDYSTNIQKACLDNGILTLEFTYNIPEKEKPQKIAIGVHNGSRRVLEHNAA